MSVVPLIKCPTKQEAQNIIRGLAEKGSVVFHKHAKARRKQRKITTVQILTCLTKGRVVETPFQTLSHKGWETAVEGQAAGENIRVVVCLRWKNDLLVITAY